MKSEFLVFVSKNNIFQEFEKAFFEFKQVCEEYEKNNDDIGKSVWTFYM